MKQDFHRLLSVSSAYPPIHPPKRSVGGSPTGTQAEVYPYIPVTQAGLPADLSADCPPKLWSDAGGPARRSLPVHTRYVGGCSIYVTV